MFGIYRKRYKKLKREIYIIIDGLKTSIRGINWRLNYEGVSVDSYVTLTILKDSYINQAKDLSKIIEYEWKKEYEEES